MSERKVFGRACSRLFLEPVLIASLAAMIGFVPTNAAAQVLYGSVTGNIVDGSGAAVPGATVVIKDEATGLALTAVTDSSGVYTIRNVTGGTYTLRASLQGFKEFVQTGVPITAGGVVRINGRLEVGALTESVTVTTEAAVLKTDKQDVSTELRPADVVNLPLNQYRNYQYLMNLVPGATPPEFQNAQTDTPGRSLSVNVNGTNRNNNVTRIDGAASINVWLPHHAGYVAPVETIEVVNVSTNNFDAAQGMTGGAAVTVQTKSGTNSLRGSAFYFRQQDEFNARRGYFDPNKVDASTVDRRRHGRWPASKEQALLLRIVGAQQRAPGFLHGIYGAYRQNAHRGLQRGAGDQPEFQDLRPEDGHLGRREPHRLRQRDGSRRSHQQHRTQNPVALSGAKRSRYEQRTTEQRAASASADSRSRQLRCQGQLESHRVSIRSGRSSR